MSINLHRSFKRIFRGIFSRRVSVFLFVCFLSVFQLSAQTIPHFRINFGLQYSIPEWVFNYKLPKHHEKNAGVGAHLNPVYFFKEDKSLGLILEYTEVAESPRTDNIRSFNIYSIVPTYNQYFTKCKIKPFIGGGLGYYEVNYYATARGAGARILAGINVYKGFEVSLEFNRLLYDVEVDLNRWGKFDNYYVAFKGSFSIGFGKR